MHKNILERQTSNLKMITILVTMGVLILLTAIISGGTIKSKSIKDKGSPLAIDQNNLRQTIVDLQAMGARDSAKDQQAASGYIQQQLLKTGMVPEVQGYEYKGEKWENIIITFPGQSSQVVEILAVAHYDTKTNTSSSESPGADDNASGVAVILELARIISQQSHAATMKFVFFSNEEKGRAGSKFFVGQAQKKDSDILAVVNVDGVGYTPGLKEMFGAPLVLLYKEQSMQSKLKIMGKLAKNLFMKPFRRDTLLKVVTRKEGQFLLNQCTAKQKQFRLDCRINHET